MVNFEDNLFLTGWLVVKKPTNTLYGNFVCKQLVIHKMTADHWII